MFAIIYLLGTFIADLFKSRRRLELENLFLRHQLNIVLRRPPQRVRLRGSDRVLIVWMMRMCEVDHTYLEFRFSWSAGIGPKIFALENRTALRAERSCA